MTRQAKPGREISKKEPFHLPVESLASIDFWHTKNLLERFLADRSCVRGPRIGANLEEATAAQSKADFVSKCNIALKEARETHYWLRLFTETQVVSAERLSGLLKESDELIAILTTIVKNARLSE